jgi:hypothetical protein
LKSNESSLAWDPSERGTFSEDYFDPVKIPVVEHIPWVRPNFRVPPALRPVLIKDLKDKLANDIIEPSNSSYRNSWFFVPKKDGTGRLVWDLQPLNAVTIRDAGVPPHMEEIVESFSGHAIYSVFDLMDGYYGRVLDEASRDLTTIQTPLGTFRLKRLPIGATNSVSIFHGDITFLLQDEIPHVAQPFIDDIGVKGSKTRYEDESGKCETIPENPLIRRFVWEHICDVNRVMHRIKHAGGTFSVKKMFVCTPEAHLLGHCCTYYGRIPDTSHVDKILNWAPCKNLTEVRGFLGTAGVVRIFIEKYSERARPLSMLTKKDIPFHWGEEQDFAFNDLKLAITNAPALRPIDYTSDNEIILAVDSSQTAVGIILMQLDNQGKRHVGRYGSLLWSDVESRYSQPKLELRGLVRALEYMRPFIIGVHNLIVEMDASFIKGMINNPDTIPHNTLNRWIAYAQLFQFTLRHVPANNHKGPDGLSRRQPGEDEFPQDAKVLDDAMDDALGLFLAKSDIPPYLFLPVPLADSIDSLPRTYEVKLKDLELATIRNYLKTIRVPDGFTPEQSLKLIHTSNRFFLSEDLLYRRHPQGRHQRILFPLERFNILKQTHDHLGHKGYYPIYKLLSDRFWWPSLTTDLSWYLKTCNICQLRNTLKLHIPPVVALPAPLFSKCYVDTMFMAKSPEGFRHLAQARCSGSAWAEYAVLERETAEQLGKFLFREIMCRWGAIQEIVSDNGSPWVKALDWLSAKYHINHITISPYNSQASGIVERPHRTIRESLVRISKPDLSDWVENVPYVFWADRVTTRRSTGHSPYYMTHGVEPLFPFDLTEATFLAPKLDRAVTTVDLVAFRARQLQKREHDLRQMQRLVYRSRQLSAERFRLKYQNTIFDLDFKPGQLVLVHNAAGFKDLGGKWKPRYLGPYIVVRRTKSGNYRLAELDGTVSRLRFAQKRIIPYFLRSTAKIPLPNSSLRDVDQDINQNDSEEESSDDEI